MAGGATPTPSARTSSSPTAGRTGAEPYLCTNAGTGTPEEMSDWVEYCNLRGSQPLGGCGAANGHAEPARRPPLEHRQRELRLLGDRRAGPRGMGPLRARGRQDDAPRGRPDRAGGRRVRRPRLGPGPAGRLEPRRCSGPRPRSSTCSPSTGTRCCARGPATWNRWPSTASPRAGCGARSAPLELLGLEDQIRIAFDEWNPRGWHFPGFDGRERPDLTAVGPQRRQLDLHDGGRAAARVVPQYACLRHCTSVAMTNLSPLVNTRGPIFTHPGGIVLRPTYHVCEMYSR